MNHYTEDGGYVLDDSLPLVTGHVPGVYRVKVHEFNEAMLFGNIEMKNGTSVGPVSSREIELIRGIGFRFDLIPVECEHCKKLQEQLDRVMKVNEKLGGLLATHAVKARK